MVHEGWESPNHIRSMFRFIMSNVKSGATQRTSASIVKQASRIRKIQKQIDNNRDSLWLMKDDQRFQSHFGTEWGDVMENQVLLRKLLKEIVHE